MVNYKVLFSHHALKDAKKLTGSNLAEKTKKLIELLKTDPFQQHPSFEKLIGNLHNTFARRINHHHRIIYEVKEQEKVVRVLRMWTHYGD
ncbi:Txe/YoeB family addiction module toxin [Sulfurimonas microaerophilic]|uniref:Txe/YoeB family addiction module toxin n=1 Tax=Sulfurimonas microaerophilic TaxID=3058392 RepID=UPI002714F7EF|nr:Txe/YoeB family addiction module toxin [Sulfurimonas sp. hsl 1-7]